MTGTLNFCSAQEIIKLLLKMLEAFWWGLICLRLHIFTSACMLDFSGGRFL